MTAKMIIDFDCEETRLEFFRDISGLIFWNDSERDEDSQQQYKEKTSFAFPDLDMYDCANPDSSDNYLSYSLADLAIDPQHPLRWFKSK